MKLNLENDKPVIIALAISTTNLSALTSYAWVTLEDMEDSYRILIHRNYADAVSYLNYCDNFCYCVIHSESFRKACKELDDFLNKAERVLSKDDSILLG